MTDTSLAKFNDISCQLSASLLGSVAATRELWRMNWERLELRWGRAVDQKVAAVHGMLCMIPPHDSNQYCIGTPLLSLALLLIFEAIVTL
jgi:hypothetical protein